jgi:hypothetical protein
MKKQHYYRYSNVGRIEKIKSYKLLFLRNSQANEISQIVMVNI